MGEGEWPPEQVLMVDSYIEIRKFREFPLWLSENEPD